MVLGNVCLMTKLSTKEASAPCTATAVSCILHSQASIVDALIDSDAMVVVMVVYVGATNVSDEEDWWHGHVEMKLG